MKAYNIYSLPRALKLNLIKPLDTTANVQEEYKIEEHAQLYQKYGISKFQTWRISMSHGNTIFHESWVFKG